MSRAELAALQAGAERQRRKRLRTAAVVGITCCACLQSLLEGVPPFDVVLLDEVRLPWLVRYVCVAVADGNQHPGPSFIKDSTCCACCGMQVTCIILVVGMWLDTGRLCALLQTEHYADTSVCMRPAGLQASQMTEPLSLLPLMRAQPR
jgi:hypothetical protein